MNNVLGDGIGRIELVDSMGNDLSIVNAARASFDKQTVTLDVTKDEKLIAYLLKHKHKSPFRGVVFTFKVKAPLFICRQWWKHVIASSSIDGQNQWNEQSLRYVEVEKPEFYIPKNFSCQSKSNRQASQGFLPDAENTFATRVYTTQCLMSAKAYKDLIDLGVSREQARGVLPSSLYTTFVWTVSLDALINFISLREATGAQGEIVAYSRAIKELITPFVPVTIKLLSQGVN